MKRLNECIELAKLIDNIIDIKLEMLDDLKLADYHGYREHKEKKLDPLLMDLAFTIYRI